MSPVANLSLAFDILARDSASKTFDKVGDSADKAGRKGTKMGTAFKAGFAVAAVAAVGFAKGSVSAFVESEQASLRLDEALAKFPKTNDVARASFDKLNAALALKTKFDDDATASGQAVLAQFQLTGKQIQSLTPLLQDYAAKTGKDLPTAAGDLGKALLGQGRALKEVGIDFKDAGSTGANFEQIMGGLRTQVGGFATAEGKSAAGQAAILSNQFGEVQETVGAKLTPVLTKLAGILLRVIGFIQRNSAVILPLVAVLATVIAAVKTYTAVQTLLNFVLTANPIGLIIIAIAALVAGIIVAYKNSETFRNIVNTLWDVLRRFIGFTPLGALIMNFGKIKSIVESIIDKVGDLIAAIKRIKLPSLPGGGLLDKIPGFAQGGTLGAGFSIVGERGPELLYSPRGGQQVISNDEIKRTTGTSGLSIGTINVTSGPTEDASQSLPRSLRNLAFTMGV